MSRYQLYPDGDFGSRGNAHVRDHYSSSVQQQHRVAKLRCAVVSFSSKAPAACFALANTSTTHTFRPFPVVAARAALTFFGDKVVLDRRRPKYCCVTAVLLEVEDELVGTALHGPYTPFAPLRQLGRHG